MIRYSLLATGLALTLLCAGSQANNQPDKVGANDQTGANQTNSQPATAPATDQPNAGQALQQPDQGQVNPQPDNIQANPQPDNNQAIQQPNADQTNPQPNPNPNIQQPAPGQPAPGGNTQQGAMPAAANLSPLQEFVSHQMDEVAALQPQFDAFRAANRTDALPVLYHMVRDHVLVADAARNLLARRGQVSHPMTTTTAEVNMTGSPDDLIRQDIDDHQQAISQTQQLLANASSPEEKNIYQRALDASQKHLNWLQSLSQGQRVAVNYFGPTVPLSRIAGYREEVGQAPSAGSGRAMRRARTASYRRGTWARHRRHSRYYYRYRGTGRYR